MEDLFFSSREKRGIFLFACLGDMENLIKVFCWIGNHGRFFETHVIHCDISLLFEKTFETDI